MLYLAYNNLPEVVSYYVKILRFPSTAEAERQWTSRRNGGESEVVTVAGAEVLSTKPGQMLRADLRAGMDTLECRAGRYWIRIAPAKPEPGDPGLKFVLKQMERIGQIREPGGAASAAPPHR